MSVPGDICTVEIFYKGTSGSSKIRPVLVLNVVNSKYTIAEITTVEPKDPPGYYDQYKEEIKNWKKYGLDKKSYVKCKNIHNVEGPRFVKQIGVMDSDEFENIVNRIMEVN